MNSRLRATGVSRSFQGVQALREVDLEVGRREVVGLIGPNGAGKTTLVNCITGFDLPDSGSVVVEGSDVTSWKAARRARAGRCFAISSTEASTPSSPVSMTSASCALRSGATARPESAASRSSISCR